MLDKGLEQIDLLPDWYKVNGLGETVAGLDIVIQVFCFQTDVRFYKD
jgi:hypothetical protein